MLLLCCFLTCWLHRASGGSIPTYLRVTFAHSNPNIVFMYLPEETKRKMQAAIVTRRANMPTITEELGFKKKKSQLLDTDMEAAFEETTVAQQQEEEAIPDLRLSARAAAMAAMAAADASIKAGPMPGKADDDDDEYDS